MFKGDVKEIPVPMGRLVSTSQAGALLDVDGRTVRRMIGREQLVPVHIGHRLYVTRASVLKAVSARGLR